MIFLSSTYAGCLSSDEQINIQHDYQEEGCITSAERGVVISFDDSQNIESWGEHRDFLNFNGVKATFFVDRWNKLDSWEIEILNNLSKDGHEIGFHSRSHGDYFEFLEQNLTEYDYLNEEILPGIDQMEDVGFNATSFAYPRGHRDESIDAVLLDYFSVLRGTQSNKNGSESWIAACEDLRVFRSFPLILIDESNESRDYRQKWTKYGFDTVENESVTLLFNGHGIETGGYPTSVEYLEFLFSQINHYDLPYLLMSDLDGEPLI
jgi:peptidoglycan/xylan/chitin deacetylase (PgdA/CDA1 family)